MFFTEDNGNPCSCVRPRRYCLEQGNVKTLLYLYTLDVKLWGILCGSCFWCQGAGSDFKILAKQTYLAKRDCKRTQDEMIAVLGGRESLGVLCGLQQRQGFHNPVNMRAEYFQQQLFLLWCFQQKFQYFVVKTAKQNGRNLYAALWRN